MPRPLTCQFCRVALDPAQEFAYHVESLTPEGALLPAGLRRLPAIGGQTARVCRQCRVGSIQRPTSRATRPVLLAAVAVVSLWALTAKLANILPEGPS